MLSSDSGIGKYLYWSDRAVRTVAEDNGIELNGRRRWNLRLAVQGIQAGRASQERTTRNRLEESRRIKTSIGSAAVEGFGSPPPALFTKGVGKISFSEFLIHSPGRRSEWDHASANRMTAPGAQPDPRRSNAVSCRL
jgi:hypothetical protein